jgi:hypothetical protein
VQEKRESMETARQKLTRQMDKGTQRKRNHRDASNQQSTHQCKRAIVLTQTMGTSHKHKHHHAAKQHTLRRALAGAVWLRRVGVMQATPILKIGNEAVSQRRRIARLHLALWLLQLVLKFHRLLHVLLLPFAHSFRSIHSARSIHVLLSKHLLPSLRSLVFHFLLLGSSGVYRC